jgi:MoaA/NifB/PqqE/SkfB family radical SAM enzyme
MTSNLLHEYQNGNVLVKIYEDGTKIREWPDGESPISEYPESCDLKITQYCDMDAICVYCHEMSNKQGQHGDLDAIDSIWASQKPGTELAIGGGNPLAHPGLPDFLRKMKGRGIIPNVTVNIMHMKKFAPMIREFQAEKLMYGLGISYRGPKSLALLPEDMNVIGFRFHELKGAKKGIYSVGVSGNWRITFKFDVNGPFDIDLEDYH